MEKNFYSEVLASLDAVRIAWRNPTMHVERQYGADEAEHILIAVRGLMKAIAVGIDANGERSA